MSGLPQADANHARSEIRIDDWRIRAVLAPIVGLCVPHVAGNYGPLTPESPWYWIGSAWFILTSFTIWQGNRAFWMRFRRTTDWLSHPVRRLALLVASSVFFTGPVIIGMMVVWYRIAPFGQTDWAAIRTAAIVTIVATCFIVHTYETVYLIRQRARDHVTVARLERATAQAELEALRGQIDPHFMFNSLNTLAGLIEEEPEHAAAFTISLAEMYRYILRNRNRELVPVKEEVAFLHNYYSLLRLRFDGAVRLEIGGLATAALVIPPVSLQMLLENAVKHNEFSADDPLVVHARAEQDHIVVWNARHRPRRSAATSRMGLKNLDERCRITLGRPIDILDDGMRFQVRVPVRGARPGEPAGFALAAREIRPAG